MPRKNATNRVLYNDVHSHPTDSVIKIWTVNTPRKNAAGQEVKYEVLLYDDGCISCNCPGWTFKRKGKPRECKHTREMVVMANETVELYKSGALTETHSIFDFGQVIS